MPVQIDQIKDRIKKLLRLANDDGAFAGEIANAINFAKDLMDRHNITEDDLEQEKDVVGELHAKERKTDWVGGRGMKLAQWEKSLASFIARFCSVGVYRDNVVRIKRTGGIAETDKRGEPVRAFGFTFYGLAEDVDIAIDLYNEWSITIASLARLKFAKAFRDEGRSYCDGFVSGLISANYKAKEHAKQIAQSQQNIGGSSTALTLIEKRGEIEKVKLNIAKDFLKSKGIKLRSATSSSNRQYGDAYNEGRVDGQSSTVNKREPRKRLEG